MPWWYSLIALAVLAPLAWKLFAKSQRTTGLVIGPWINGKCRSRGYRLRPERLGDGWTVYIEPGQELRAVQDFGFRITGKVLRFRYRCKGQFTPSEAPERPALVSLVIQRKGDDWSAYGEKANYRLYSPAFPLTEGEHSFDVQLEGWTNVWGKPADMAPVIRDLSNLAVAFGHRGGRMHGVTGSGTFTLVELELQP